jgi:hypothetical protein
VWLAPRGLPASRSELCISEVERILRDRISARVAAGNDTSLTEGSDPCSGAFERGFRAFCVASEPSMPATDRRMFTVQMISRDGLLVDEAGFGRRPDLSTKPGPRIWLEQLRCWLAPRHRRTDKERQQWGGDHGRGGPENVRRAVCLHVWLGMMGAVVPIVD